MPHLAPDQCQFGGGAKADGFSAIKSGESGPSHAVVGEFGDDTPAAGGGIGGEVGATEGGFGGGDRIRQISTNEEGNVVDFPGMPHPTLGYLVCKTSFCSAGRWVKAHDIEHLALEAQPSATKLVPFGGIILGQPVTGNGGSPSSDLDVPSEAVRRQLAHGRPIDGDPRPVHILFDSTGSHDQGSAGQGVKGVSDPLHIFLPPSIRC
jgi:hypothetical protein